MPNTITSIAVKVSRDLDADFSNSRYSSLPSLHSDIFRLNKFAKYINLIWKIVQNFFSVIFIQLFINPQHYLLFILLIH